MIVSPKFSQPFGEEVFFNVLDCIETETVNTCGVEIPLTPSGQLFTNLRNAEIDVGAHQIVVIYVFAIHAPVPLDTFKLVDR